MKLLLPTLPRTFSRSLSTLPSLTIPTTELPRESTQPRRRGAGRPIIYTCRTLQPHLFQRSDLLVLSKAKRPCIHIDDQDVRIWYHTKTNNRIEFPENTRGFLYYYHDPATPPSTGEIRFRITPETDVMNFHEGVDLMTPNYVPWSMTLLQLTMPTFAPFTNLLLREGLVDKALMESMSGKAFRCHKRPLHYLEQPFAINLQTSNLQFCVFDGKTIGAVRYQWAFRDNRATIMSNPYSGHLLVRFERSTLPEHEGSCIIVLRILKILEKIQVTLPGYDMYLPLPQEGELVQTVNKDRRTRRPFIVNLDKPPGIWKNLNLLVKR